MSSLPLVVLVLSATACTNETIDPDREFMTEVEEVKVVDRNPRQLQPEEEPEPEYHWLQAFDRGDIGDEVDVALEGDLFEDNFQLRLDDLYVELWHDGSKGAKRLLQGVRNCDQQAAIRFGKPMFVRSSELETPSEWAFEVRYLQSDELGLEAAELLRDHLRDNCDPESRELVREIVDKYGLVLRPVPDFPYAEDPGTRSPLVLVLAPDSGQSVAEAAGADEL